MFIPTTTSASDADRDARRRSEVLATWAVVAGCGVMVMVLGMVSTGRWVLATVERNVARLAFDVSPAA